VTETTDRSERRGENPPDDTRREVDDLVRTIQGDLARSSPRSGAGKKDRSPALLVFLILAVLANAYVWIGQPAWIMGERAGISSVEEAEGVLRFRMYVQAQRIQGYVQRHGSLPERLDQTGDPFEGIRYQRTGPDSWELVGELQGARLVLPSSMPIREFLEPGS